MCRKKKKKRVEKKWEKGESRGERRRLEEEKAKIKMLLVSLRAETLSKQNTLPSNEKN